MMSINSKRGFVWVPALVASLTLAGPGVMAAENPGDPVPRAEQPGALEQKFAVGDANSDGLLSRSEFAALEIKQGAFAEADTDGNGSLDQSEFVKANSISERISAKAIAEDSWITTKVKAILLKEDGLSGLAIGVETKDGVVQLSGWVKNQDQVQRAQSLTSQVKGVRRVQNDLQVEG